jgi:hypothetical protein
VRAVIIYYIICEGTVDEHFAAILIDKLPAVETLADDSELAAATSVLSGIDPNSDDDAWIDAILEDLDIDDESE